MNNWLRAVTLSLVLLLFAASGCSGSQKTATQTETTATTQTGPAEGRTLLIATQNVVSHSEDSTETEVQTEVGTVTQRRDEPFILEQTASDIRATGNVNVILESDVRADGSGELWGTWVLSNGAGTWEGEMHSTMSASSADVPDTQYLQIVATGTGAYEGLELVLQGSGGEITEDFKPGTDIVATGWIEQAR